MHSTSEKEIQCLMAHTALNGKLTYCFQPDHWSCWTCKSLSHSTQSLCSPARNSAAGVSPAPQSAPWCCCKGPEPPGRELDWDLSPGADWSAAVYWGFVLAPPPLSSSWCGRCPQWCKWRATKSLSRSSREGKTGVRCPNSCCPLRSLSGRDLWSKKKSRQNSTEQNPPRSLFSFHSGREWVPFLQHSHFLKCYVIVAKRALAWERIRVIFLRGENDLNSS